MANKQRLDLLLVEKKLAPSRTRAQSLIMEGVVFVNGQRVDKAGTVIKQSAEITVKDSSLKFVSRGGFKLEAALDHNNIDVTAMTAADIGASTGGFTDCLLKRGAEKVYAIDVGYGQLDWKLRNDERVVVMEKVNARYLKSDALGEKVDIAVMDLSFISLTKVIPSALELLKPKGIIVSLIKPQFEVGKGEVGKGGIVRDEEKRQRVVDKITEFMLDNNVTVMGVIPSPILGAEGNKEFLITGVLKESVEEE